MTTGSSMNVSWAAMEAGTQQFTQVHTAVNGIVEDLQSNLRTNLGAEWMGSAQSGWEEVQQVWQSAQTRLAAIHAALTNAITTAHDNYSQAESANTAAWNGG
jgi:WXG100 family type VII secretion target